MAELIDEHLAVCVADIKRLKSLGFRRAQVGDILVDAIEHASGSGNGDALLDEWAARWKRFMDSMDDDADLEHAADAFIEADMEPEKKKPGNPLVSLYAQLWKEKHPGAPLSITGADAGRLKQLGKNYKNHPGAAEKIVRAFFTSDDPFILKSGHSTNALMSQEKSLLTGASTNAIDNRRGFNDRWAKFEMAPGSEVRL